MAIILVCALFAAPVWAKEDLDLELRKYYPFTLEDFEHAHLTSGDYFVLEHFKKHGMALNYFPAYFEDHETVADRVRLGDAFDDARKEKIADRAVDLFDRTTGRFALPRDGTISAFTLASESGTQPLLALRHNHSFLDSEVSVSHQIYADLKTILERLPQLQLFLAVKNADMSHLQALLANWPERLRARVRVFAHDLKWQVWAQDRSKPAIWPLSTVALNDGADYEAHSAGRVAEVFEPFVTALDLRFHLDGGNIVVGDQDIFIGRKSIENLMSSLWTERGEIIKMLGAKFGKRVTEIGPPGFDQVSFHIDLDMAIVRDWSSAAHREVVLLQSPVLLMERLLHRPVRQLLARFPNFEAGDVEAFDQARREAVRRLALGEANGAAAHPTERALLKSLDLYAIGLEDLKYRYCRKIIEETGYEIVDLPGTAILLEKNGPAVKGPGGARPMGGPVPIFSYTNLIASGKTVLMANYAIPEIDQLAQDTLRGLGFEVVKMHSTTASMRWQGGMRCLSETFRQPRSFCAPDCELELAALDRATRQ